VELEYLAGLPSGIGVEANPRALAGPPFKTSSYCRRSLEELSALALPLKTVSRLVDVVDPAVFDALGISFLGHKLLIAKGIRLLHQRQ